MRRVYVEIDCDAEQCNLCEWLHYLNPPSLIFFRCNLFNATISHGYEGPDIIALRCDKCREHDLEEGVL